MTARSRPPAAPRARALRIAEVAREAGVSPATVSRALSTPDIVSDQTRARVLDAVRRTGYTPNIAGRNLRVRRTMMALVVVPDIGNPFFSEVLRGIDQALSADGYGLIIGNLDKRREKEGEFAELVFAGQVDGVLLLNGRLLAARGRTIDAAGVPLVAACEGIPRARIPQVEAQNREAARDAVLYLAALGHRRFAYLSGPKSNILERERAAGFRDGLKAVGLPVDAAACFAGDFTFPTGVAAAKNFLAMPHRPTAVFAANDEMAISFLKTVHDAGLRVPRDVSIVGFDGIEYADYCEPPLTTLRQPRRALGAAAATALVDLMTGRHQPEPRQRLPVELLVRGSSGPSGP